MLKVISMQELKGREAWNQVMQLRTKETRTKGIANTLGDDEITTILATMEFFGASNYFLKQTIFDLKRARYRLFDWIAMCLNGRWHYEKNDDYNKVVVKVIAHSFLKAGGNIDKFIEDLRITDYQIDLSYERIKF